MNPGRKTLPFVRLGGAVLAFLTLLLFGAIVSRDNDWWLLEVPPGQGAPREAVVEPGQNASSVARSLVEQGLAQGDARALARWFSALKIDTRLKPGVYKIRPGTPWEIAQQMKTQEPDSYGVRLIAGSSPADLGISFSRWGGEASLLRELSDSANFPAQIRGILPENPKARFAFLLPDTYNVTPSEASVREFVRLASKNWLEQVGPFLPVLPGARWLLDRAILASINERESKDDSERARVAGVFENRLKAGMPLQSCATVVFAWKEKGRILQGLNYADLKIDSPYNTYLHRGLPPGPIGTPSAAAWKASLLPERHEFLFFALSPSGRHFFSRTYAEHLAAQKRAEEGKPMKDNGRETDPQP